MSAISTEREYARYNSVRPLPGRPAGESDSIRTTRRPASALLWSLARHGDSNFHFSIFIFQFTILLFAALFSAVPASAGDDFPAVLTRFRPYDKNPVFRGAGGDAWDAKIRERGWILREGGQWRMWYTGYANAPDAQMMLGYATSSDGLNWTRHPGNPIYREHWVEDMMVVKQGETYYMFAEGKDDQAQLLTSRDGLRWKREGSLDVRYTNGEPISAGPYGTPTAWFEDGVWHLFYERSDKGVWLAKSKDLKVWTNVQDEPVLSPGPEAYDRLMIALNQIIRHDGRYYAYYHGSGTAEKPRLWTTNIAVSTDLVHWKKYPGNPLLPERDNKSSGIVVHDGKQFRLYTMHPEVNVHFAEDE
ncbi:MAG: glycosylase [Deltaproteobacteria bacterium]